MNVAYRSVSKHLVSTADLLAAGLDLCHDVRQLLVDPLHRHRDLGLARVRLVTHYCKLGFYLQSFSRCLLRGFISLLYET